MAALSGPPLPTNVSDFSQDDRISFSRLDGKYLAVQDDGSEFEFDEATKKWIATDDADDEDQALLRQQPPQDELEAPNSRKRKHGPSGPEQGSSSISNTSGNYNNGSNINDDAGSSAPARSRPTKKQKPPPQPRPNTAVYVTGLPLDATVDEVHELFSRKGGLIQEQIDGGGPRIKMYTDDQGRFKGDALVVFFKPQSVQMAVMLLDDTDFRLTPTGTSAGRMRVQPADDSYRKEGPTVGGGGAGDVTGATTAGGGEAAARPPPQRNNQDRQKIIKKTQKLESKLADWSDDEEHPAAAALGLSSGASAASSKWDRLVILKHMFTLDELAEDPAALLEIKEDVRDECAKLGPVTNVVLYDLEPDGIVSVRFRTPEAAQACVRTMHGRSFAGRVVEAATATAKPRFRKSRDEAADESD